MTVQKPSAFSMVPIKRIDVFQSIIERIGGLIDEQLSAGDRLPSERELSETLGVSRTSVRQALKVLESMGKVETRVGSGTYVVQRLPDHAVQTWQLGNGEITKAFIRQLIVARTGIERTVFEACAETIDEAGLEELRRLLNDNASDLQTEDDSEAGGLDLSFETKVAELTGNTILVHLQRQIHQLWVQAWRAYGYVPDKEEVFHREHLEIVEAMKARDLPLVSTLIVRHVNKNID